MNVRLGRCFNMNLSKWLNNLNNNNNNNNLE